MNPFLKKVAERAIKTFAQTLVGVLTVAGPLNLISVDWRAALGVAVSATVLSVLTSIASRPLGPDQNSPSVV